MRAPLRMAATPVLGVGLHRQLADMQRALDAGVRIVNDRDKFAVQMDVGEYQPEEINVNVHDEDKAKGVSAYLVVSGKHEERRDERGGFVSRSFQRRYALPDDVDAKQLQCNRSNRGESLRSQSALNTRHSVAASPAQAGRGSHDHKSRHSDHARGRRAAHSPRERQQQQAEARQELNSVENAVKSYDFITACISAVFALQSVDFRKRV